MALQLAIHHKSCIVRQICQVSKCMCLCVCVCVSVRLSLTKESVTLLSIIINVSVI